MKDPGNYIKLLFIFISLNCNAQNIYVNSFKESPFDVSAIENSQKDSQGNVCAIIKLRTNLVDISIDSDGEVTKIENNPGEYRIWLSPISSRLVINLKGYESLEYTIPRPLTSNSVYIVNIAAVQYLKEKVVYRIVDTLEPYIWINTNPQNAKIFLNNQFIGTTPSKIVLADSINDISIMKRNYKSLFIKDTLRMPVKGYDLDLEFNSKKKRFFAFGLIGTDAYDFNNTVRGFMVGRLGKTGWYISGQFCNNNIKNEAIINIESGEFEILDDQRGFIYTYNPSFDFPQKSDEYNFKNSYLTLCMGLTQQIHKGLFIFSGTGYGKRNGYDLVSKTKIQKLDGSDSLYQEDIIALITDFSIDCLIADIGVIGRFYKSILLSFNFSVYYDLTHKMYCDPLIFFGAGYNF